MDFYFSGLFLAFIIGVIKVFITVANIASVRASNLKKVGIYYNYFNGAFTEKNPSTNFNFIFYCAWMLILAPIFSWISIISAVLSLISAWNKKELVPENVKMIYYKIANIHLSRVQLIELQRELDLLLGTSTDYNKMNENYFDENYDLNKLVFDECRYITVEAKNFRFVNYSRSEDYQCIFHSIYEYKFVQDSIYIRLVESYNDFLGVEEWHVKDGVVLKSEIQKRYEESTFKIGTYDSEIVKYCKAVEWEESLRLNVNFFIMSMHPELFAEKDLRKFARSHVERLKSGFNNVLNISKTKDYLIIENEEGFNFSWKHGDSELKISEFTIFFSDLNLKSFDVSLIEIYNYKILIAELEKYLADSKKAA